MGLEVWFLDNIRNILLAANKASAATAAVPASIDQDLDIDELARILCAFREGYKAALSTVALAFGISPSDILKENSESKQTIYEIRRPPEWIVVMKERMNDEQD